VYELCWNLLGSTTPMVCWLAASTWVGDGWVSDVENVGLACTFSESELNSIVKDMKTDTDTSPTYR
jgi:hypothetical protein